MNPQMRISGCLPDEIITEVFTKLPVKSLCRLKCVSKPILYLIEHDPSFIEKARRKTPIHCLHEDSDIYYIYSIDTNVVAQHHPTRICLGNARKTLQLRHRDGLMCCVHLEGLSMCLLNPTTQERVSLPGSFSHYEFYLDPSSNKYKVLGWKQRPDSITNDFYILTLDKDLAWTRVSNTLEAKYLAGPCTIVNGELFWRVEDIQHIVSFNLADEEFRVIDTPPALGVDEYSHRLIEFEGSLVLIQLGQRDGVALNLWMLKDTGVGNDWILMKSITLPIQGKSVLGSCVSLKEARDVFGRHFSIHSGELMIILWTRPLSRREFALAQCVYFYSFLNGQFKELKFTEPLCIDGVLENYVENHVSLKSLCG